MSFPHVKRTGIVSEDRSWMIGTHGTADSVNPNVTLSPALFTKGTHYPKGYIPSGTVIGQVTATKLWGPYDPAATDGRQNAKGVLFSSVEIEADQTRAAGALFWHGVIRPDRLPFKSGTGSLDAKARTALAAIYFTD